MDGDDGTCATHPEGRTETVYDATTGRVRWTIDPKGVYTTPVYDETGRRVAECRSTTERDDLDLETAADAHADAHADHGDGLSCRLFELDALGRKITETHANGKATHYTFDAGGRLVAVTDAMDGITEYGFDDRGNMVTQEDARDRVTHYEFDAAGRRTARVLPMGQRETFAYGIAGDLTTRTDFMHRDTQHVDTDLDGRDDTVAFEDDPDVVTTYWGDGQRKTVTVGGVTTTYQIEEETGRIKQVDRTDATSIHYTFDSAGRRITTVTDPGGTEHATTYTYTPAGQLDVVSDDGGEVDYDYDEAFRLETVRG